MQDNGWDRALEIAADGNGLVGHAGGILLRKLADQCGLPAALDGALTLRRKKPQLSRGMVLVSTAIAIALGATAMADIAVLGQLGPVLGDAPSASMVRRVLNMAAGRHADEDRAGQGKNPQGRLEADPGRRRVPLDRRRGQDPQEVAGHRHSA